MDQRNRHYYRQQYSDRRKKTSFKIDTRKRPLPELEIHKNALNLRVVYPHTIFIVGIQQDLDDPEVLKSNRNLGQFGNILECKIDQQHYDQQKKYMVRFAEIYQANLAFQSINLLRRKNRLRAFFQKNRFCIHFIRGNHCRKSDCPYIHEEIDKAYYFYKEDHNAEFFEDHLSEDILDQNFDKCLEDYWNLYRLKRRKQLGLLKSPNRKKQTGLQTPAESPKKATVSELGGGGKVNDTATKGKLPEHEKAGADQDQDQYEDEEGEDEGESPYFLSTKKVMIELELMRREDFRVKEEQIEKELQEELNKLQKDESEIDSVEYRKLFDDYGIMMQPEPQQPLPSLQIGKETYLVMDEYAEIQELIMQQKQIDESREKAKSVRVAFIKQLKKNMPRDDTPASEAKLTIGQKGIQNVQSFDTSEQQKSIPFDIGKSLQKYNQRRESSKNKGYNSNRTQSDGESDFYMSRNSFRDSKKSQRSETRSKSCDYLPNPEDIIQRNNRFLFQSQISSYTSKNSRFTEESSITSFLEQSSDTMSDILIHSTNTSKPPTIKRRIRRLVKIRAIESAGPDLDLQDEFHNLYWMISPSVAEAYQKLEGKSRENFNTAPKKDIKGKTKLGKGNAQNKGAKQEAVKERKLRILENKDYFYHINPSKPKEESKQAEEVAIQEKTVQETKSQAESQEVEEESQRHFSEKNIQEMTGIILPKDNILTPGVNKKYFEASNTFTHLAGDLAADPHLKKDGSQDSENKAKNNKAQKKLTVVESQQVSIFAGKAARKQNKKLKKKTKQANNKKKPVETSANSRSRNPSHEITSKEMLNSISITTDRVDNQKDVTMESQLSQEEMTTMSQADEVVQDLKMLDSVKILRKQSDGLANFQKYDEKKELEKIQQSTNSNPRIFEKQSPSTGTGTNKNQNEENQKSKVAPESDLKEEDGESESEDDPTVSSKDAAKTIVDQAVPSDGAKKKRKRKKKKKSKAEKPEEAQKRTDKPAETVASASKAETKQTQESLQLTAQNSENINLFLKEDTLDVLADRINKIVEEEDPFEAIFQILDGPFIDNCHEIYLEKDEKKNKIVFIGDKRQFSASMFQKLYDNSGLLKDDQGDGLISQNSLACSERVQDTASWQKSKTTKPKRDLTHFMEIQLGDGLRSSQPKKKCLNEQYVVSLKNNSNLSISGLI